MSRAFRGPRRFRTFHETRMQHNKKRECNKIKFVPGHYRTERNSGRTDGIFLREDRPLGLQTPPWHRDESVPNTRGNAPKMYVCFFGTRAFRLNRFPSSPYPGGTTLYDTLCLSISFRKSTPPQNRQLEFLISNSKQQVDDFVGELTL